MPPGGSILGLRRPITRPALSDIMGPRGYGLRNVSVDFYRPSNVFGFNLFGFKCFVSFCGSVCLCLFMFKMFNVVSFGFLGCLDQWSLFGRGLLGHSFLGCLGRGRLGCLGRVVWDGFVCDSSCRVGVSILTSRIILLKRPLKVFHLFSLRSRHLFFNTSGAKNRLVSTRCKGGSR